MTEREKLIAELIESGETRTECGWDKAIDTVLKIIDEVEHTDGLSKADEYGLLRMKVKDLKGGEQG